MATAKEALKWVDELYGVLSKRRPEIEQAFNYFAGKQPLAYASQEWRKYHANRYEGFADNWCGVVGRSPVERLRIDGIRVGDDVEVVDAAEKLLFDDWKRNELGSQSKQGFLASTIAKRSATLVWGNGDEEPEVTWEHPAQVVVAYAASNSRTRLAGLKVWIEDDHQFATLYLPNEVWKFQRTTIGVVTNGRTEGGLYVAGDYMGGGGWKPREVGNELWPLPNPLGEVPLVEWVNRPMLGMEPLSDIQGTMAMQNAINMLWAYLFTAADHASMAARVVLGAEPPKIPILNSEGQVIGSQPAKIEDLANGRLLFLPGVKDKTPTISQWDSAKLDVFTNVVDDAVGHVAAQSSTPGHYLLTNEKFANLNGDALTAAEVPLVQKCDAAIEGGYDFAARDTFRLMAKVRGNDALAERVRLSTIQWKDRAMHSLSQVADAATKDRAVGISLATVLQTRYGMTPPEVAAELERVRAEQSDPFLQQAVDESRTRAAALAASKTPDANVDAGSATGSG